MGNKETVERLLALEETMRQELVVLIKKYVPTFGNPIVFQEGSGDI